MAMAQDKAALVKQFIDLQQPGIEALARGLVEQSSAPDRAGRLAVPADASAGREARSRRARPPTPSSRSTSTRPIRSCATRPCSWRRTPWDRSCEQNFSEEELRQLLAWISSPLSKKYQELNPKMQSALTEKLVAETRAEHRAEDARSSTPTWPRRWAPRPATARQRRPSRRPRRPPRSDASGTRPYNFSAGPAAMPEAVLQRAAAEMLDWQGSGMSVMEMSHRGKEFGAICTQAEADIRALLAVPAHFHILFMQGGGLGENAIVPMNLSRGASADFVITGSWSAKSQKEAQRYCNAQRRGDQRRRPAHPACPIPRAGSSRATRRYVHICTNETIHGIEFQELPDLAALGSEAPLVIDFSSHVASRPVDWRARRPGFRRRAEEPRPGRPHDRDRARRPAGPRARHLPQRLQLQDGGGQPVDVQHAADLGHLHRRADLPVAARSRPRARSRGVEAMEQRNIAKAQLLYDFIDGSRLLREQGRRRIAARA